jgi:hypothetical protein
LYQNAKRTKGDKRPADVIGAAFMIGRIATGEIGDLTTEDARRNVMIAGRTIRNGRTKLIATLPK